MSDIRRIEDLEVRLMHQESAIEELSIASHRQQNQLDDIKSELQQIRIILRELSDGESSSPVNEPPPHY